MHDKDEDAGWFSDVLKVAPHGYCCLDTEFRYRYINDWLARLNGIAAEEHIGFTVRQMLPDVADGIEQQLRQVIETGVPIVNGWVVAETPAQPDVKRAFRHTFAARRNDDNRIIRVCCLVEEASTDWSEEAWVLEARQRRQSALAKLDLLSNIERDVLTRVVGGQTNKAIGGDLDRTERTIKRHRASSMKTLDVGTLAELVELVSSADR